MKLLLKLIVILILGVVTLGVAGYFLVPPAAKSAVGEGSRYAFGVDSELGEIKAAPGLESTGLGFAGYVLESPTGFQEPLLTIGNFNVGVGTTSIVGEPKVLDQFTLENVQLTLVQDGTRNNLVPVLRHLRGLGDGTGKTEDGEPRTGAPGPKLRVGTIKVQGISARLVLKGVPGVEAYDRTFEVPAYEKDFSAITGEEGKTVAEMAALLVEDLERRVMETAEGVVPPAFMSVFQATLEGGLEGGIQGGLKGAVEAATEGAKQEAQGKLEGATEELQKKIDDAAKDARGAAGGALEGATKDVKKGIGGLLGGKEGGR